MTPPDDPLANTEQNTSHNDQSNASQIARELHWLEKLNIFGQMGLVIVGITAASIYGCQLREMKRTNELTQQALAGSNNSLAKTLNKMQSQVDATNTLAVHAKVQADNATVMADSSRIQARASQEFADAAQRNADIAKDAMKATIDNFHGEDRAWVGISQTKPLSYVMDPTTHNVGMTVAFTFRNYGHSAAQHVRFIAELNSDIGDISVPCQKLATIHMEDVLLPTQEHTLNWAMNLTNAQIVKGWSHQNPQVGRILFLKINGCIEYTDRNDEAIPHLTPFSYMVFWTKSYITADIGTIPAAEIELEPYNINPNTGQVK